MPDFTSIVKFVISQTLTELTVYRRSRIASEGNHSTVFFLSFQFFQNYFVARAAQDYIIIVKLGLHGRV